MSTDQRMTEIHNNTLHAILVKERQFWFLLGLCGLAEIAGLAAVFWLINWSNPTHRLIFACTMLVWTNLALWVFTLAIWNRIGSQRILRAIEILQESDDEQDEMFPSSIDAADT